ncbi:HK97-gp10 family putative phage morphogenesis protein [Lachnoclostridium sp.]|uniref:HK97-gp10 family putative phage morphogenesis protein n=1 Tax=Lachnoclostridium sp. TaxID=2028282 RepID=UPI0028A23EBB|nr:HK97-gp10 family putative phage morphogenesis protein [Lachnoclostridium sp.]
MKSFFKIEGMNALQKSLDKLGKVPQKYVTTAARKGMNIVLSGAKSNAPVDYGFLKKGMKLNGERSKVKGKKVFSVVFDSEYNDIYQKDIVNPINAQSDTAYYPFSQEYGYFLRDGTYMPGLKFIHNALNNDAQKVEKTIVDTMKKKIDQEIAKAGLK